MSAVRHDPLTLAEAKALLERKLAAADPSLWIYVIQVGVDGPIKIGISRDPARRLRELQQSHPEQLRLALTFRGLALEEKLLHEEHADLRLRGEWFRPHAVIWRQLRCYVDARKHLQ